MPAYQYPVGFHSLRNRPASDGCSAFKIHQGFYSPAPRSTNGEATRIPSLANNRMNTEGSPHELQISDGELAIMAAEMVQFWLAQRGNGQVAPNHTSRKRPGQPGPNLEVEPGKQGVAHEGLPIISQEDSGLRHKKRRRIMKDDEMGNKTGAQSGDTQELPVRRPLPQVKEISKLSHGSLGMETLVALPQGVSPLLRPGPTITDATLGPHQDTYQAWTKRRVSGNDAQEEVGIEDAHDEQESDKERWARLMRYEDGKWRCNGCGGKAFSDRCTLQRHCSSAVHAKQRDWRKCPLCPKQYRNLRGVKRHMKQKHTGEGTI